MKVLGIETTCDETAAAVVEDGTQLLSNVVSSQVDLHKAYGGVVPEVAARSHIEVILPVIQEAFVKANTSWDGIDAIAVANGPGLLGSLLIGTLTARTLALVKQKPLYGVNHVMAHTYGSFISPTPPSFPLLSLTVSGGHTQLVLFRDHFDYEILGQTRDDAVGEAFDKVARILGLPYPGGPSLMEAAKHGNVHAFALPKPQMASLLDFSFSGLKTAVLRTAQEAIGKDYAFASHEIAPLLSQQQRADLAASFANTAVDILVNKTLEAYRAHQPQSVVLAGGVAANTWLRQRIAEVIPGPVHCPPLELCTDNGATIASLGFFAAERAAASDAQTLEVFPSLSM